MNFVCEQSRHKFGVKLIKDSADYDENGRKRLSTVAIQTRIYCLAGDGGGEYSTQYRGDKMQGFVAKI